MSKYILPAEWEPHEATWIAWPHNKNDWPGKFSSIKWVYAEIVKNISFGEKVSIIVQSKDHKLKTENVLKSANANLSNIEYFIKKTNRGWLRDSAPFFVKDRNSIIAVDFKFNGWAKYDNYKLDDKIPRFISNRFNLRRIVAEHNGEQVILEGGSIDVNGKGTLITTEECLLNQKVQVRNPGFTKQDYFEVFKNYLGIINVMWLGKGIAGDDTHGHVDDLCRFVNDDTVILVQPALPAGREEKSSDKNYHPLNENRERLQNIYLPNGSKLNVGELPMPSPLLFKGRRLPASYANFYISNYAVLVPTFNDPNDRIALGILSDLFPGRKVIGIHSVDLVWGLGTIHCSTKEQPST